MTALPPAGANLGVLLRLAWLILYLALLAAVLTVRFRGGYWRRIELVRSSEIVTSRL